MPEIDRETVEKVFRGVSPNKAPGPDAIGGRVLKLCSTELSSVFCDIFNDSLKTSIVPSKWKAATICPVPKKTNPASLNDYRPIALTSVIMKCFEKIVLRMLKTQAEPELDPLQFAYRQNRGVEDAVLSLVQYTHSHLETSGSFVRILYVDFSSAFNTVQTHLLVQKLSDMHINPYLTLWVSDFLTDRTQTVCVKSRASVSSLPSSSLSSSPTPSSSSSSSSGSVSSCLSSTKIINTGTPQGTVISPFIFTLYTNDCQTDRDDAYIIKFSDDTALVDVSDSVLKYEQSVSVFDEWCEANVLEMNVGKTKEMIVDYKRNQTDVAALQLKGQTVERVQEYRYLGTVIDNKLSFAKNAEVVLKKCRQRMYMLYQLRSLMVSSKIMEQCYHAFIESILTFSFVCWFRTLSVKSRNSLSGVVNLCSKVVGRKQVPLEQLFQKRALKKAVSIQTDPTHPLSVLFEILPSQRRFRSVRCRTQRFRNTFVPTAVSLLNDAM